MALAKPSPDGSLLRFLRIRYLEKEETLPSDQEYNYGEVTFITKVFTREEALGIIKNLFSKQLIEINSYKVLSVEIGNSFQQTDVESFYPYGDLMFQYPTTYISSQIQGNAIPSDYSILAKPNLPAFPDLDTALVELFKLNVKGIHQIQRQIEIVIPDYRCRIKEVAITESSISASIETRHLQETDLIGKFYCRYTDRGALYNREDLVISNGKVTITSSGTISTLDFAVLSKTGQMLDYRQFTFPYWHDYNGTLKIEGESGIDAIISRGESQTVEFKVVLSDKDDFLETVSAYANKNSGTIFIGIDKHSNVVGTTVTYEELMRKVDNWIGNSCNPRPNYSMDKIVIQDKQVVLVRVEEADKNNKPCYVNNSRVYIRANGSDRLANSNELEQIFKEKYAVTDLVR